MSIPPVYIVNILLWLILTCFAGCAKAVNAEQINWLTTTPTDHPLSGTVSYTLTPNDTTLTDVIALPQEQWQSTSGSSVYIGATSQTAWLKIPLQRSPKAPENWVMTIDWASLNEVAWYMLYPDVATQQPSKSAKEPMLSTQTIDNIPFAIPISVGADQPQYLFLKIHAKAKIIVPMAVWPEAQYQNYRTQRTLIFGLLYGALSSMMAYNVLLYIFIRQASFGYYCLYIASTIGHTLALNGVGLAYVWGDVPWFNTHGFRFLIAGSFLTSILFIHAFLSLDYQKPKLRFISRLASAIWITIIVLSIAIPPSWSFLLIDIMGFISSFVFIGIAGSLWLKNDRSAKYVTIAWSLLIVSTFILMLGLNNVIPYRSELLHFQYAGLVSQVILISMALAERINRERKKRIKAQSLALELSVQASEARESELRAQAKALRIEREAKTTLEQKINEKTRELKVAMQKLEIVNHELDNLSRTDPLTGIANRRQFDHRFNEEIQRANRSQSNLALLMIDIDKFKIINDTYGHQAGDKVIQALSALMQRFSTSGTDLPARLGGEEFCLLLPNNTAEAAEQLAQRLRVAAQEQEVDYQGCPISYTISIGVFAVDKDTLTDAHNMMKIADDALYQAKRQGRNQVVIGQA